MHLLGRGRRVFVDKHAPQLAETLQSASQLGRDHTGVPQRIEIAARVCLIATTTKLGELQPEGGELSDVVLELINTSLDGLHAVELDGILGRVGHTKGIQLEVIAKLRHRRAQRK
jgi:hypothetical protein